MRAQAIYKDWLKRHEGTDRITGSKTADTRAALVEYFRERGTVMIATEAGAEGINLQFCSLVINYDLPWNPQRIEQRIGRCHRYGQKHDVVVVNFVDCSNEADARVYELLAQKFQLFEGVFGASDEVLGAIGSGVDFERRIADIYQNCRNPSEIKTSFEQLQLDLSGEISEAMVKTRQILLENFDEEVQDKLRIRAEDSHATRNKYERMLMDLTRAELADCTTFDADGFVLQRPPAGLAHSALDGIDLGRYELPRRSGDAHLYRVGHPLAVWAIHQAKNRELASSRLVFDYDAYGMQISTLSAYRGKSGWLTLTLVSVKALGNQEQHLVVAASTTDGSILAEDDPEKLLCLPAQVQPMKLSSAATSLAEDMETRKTTLLREINQRNLGYFEQEIQKLDAWADDLKLGLEQEIKEIDREIKEIRKIAATSATLDEKLSHQKRQRELESKRSKLRKELFARQDEIEAERNELIAQLESQLQQQVEEYTLFHHRMGAGVMAALEPHYMVILKKVLADRFEPSLPPLLDTTKPAAEQQAKQLSRAFSAFALHKLLDITPGDAAAAVVDDFNDKGIDAIYYHAPKETLYLLQTKLKESEQFKQDDAQSFCTGIRLLLKQDFTGFNGNVQNRKADIEAALDACSHIKLVVPYTGDGVSQSAIDALQVLLDDDDLDEERLEKQVDYYAAAAITGDLLAEQAYPPVHTDIALQKHAKVESPRTTYYGIARLADLVALHKDKGKALYERNIRYFLGSSKSDVNKAIKATLRDDPGSFFYLNNGVTAVCDEIEQKGRNPSNGFRKFKVRGLSIINGAQTVASAAEFVAQHPGSNIDDAKVMLTLIKAPADGPFGKRVTKARNHQNPVQTANFASLDENQERLRQEIAHLGFSYHYRPEAPASGLQTISLDEALRAIALRQDDPRYAVWLKNEPARLAGPESAEYQALFPGTLSGTTLVNAVLCHQAIRTLVVGYEQNAAARSQEKLIYRHAIYVITAVMMKRLRQRINAVAVIDAMALPALISQSLDELRQQASDLGQQRLTFQGPLAYFRNQSNVVAFLTDLMETHFVLHADSAIAPLRNIQNAADAYPRKRLLDYLSSRAPQV